jgi:hypothetical protein
MRFYLLASVLLGWCSAVACQICLPYPKDSLLDRLNASQGLVLARENPEQPYSLSSVRILRTSTEVPKLDLYLPSSTRRMLAVYPERSLVCGWSAGDWKSLAVYTPEMEGLLQRLLVNTWGEDGTQRARFFVEYLSSEDLQLQRMAHLEVARAPYAVIRSLGPVLDFAEVRQFLENPRMLEWHGLYILLLAQSGEQDDLSLIKKRYELCELYHSSLQAAAWTLAYLETDDGALQQIQQDYFSNAEHKEEEVSAVLDALSAYGTTHTDIQPAIAEIYQVAIERFPTQLSKRIDDLQAWQQWQLTDAVADVFSQQQQEMSIEHISKVRAFLSAASERSSAELIDEQSTALLWLCSIPLVLLGGLTYSKFRKCSGA